MTGAATAALTRKVARRVPIASIEHGHRREDALSMPEAILPFERRLGAFPLPGGRAEFRVWAPKPERVTLRVDGRSIRSSPPDWACSRRSSKPRRAPTTSTCSTASRSPTRARAGSRRACAAPRACSTRALSSGPTTAGARPRSASWCCTSCTSARFTAAGTFDAAIPHLRELRELGVTAIELMPIGRVPRPPRLGLRRRVPVCRAVLVRRAARAPAARRRRPRRGPGRDPRRRLQPRRRLRHGGADRVRPVPDVALRDPVGRRDQLRRRRLGRRARVGAAERRAVDARLPSRRPAARRRARDQGRQPRAPGGRGRPPHRARLRDRRVGHERPEGDARRRCAAAGAATRRGRTTSTTRCACC